MSEAMVLYRSKPQKGITFRRMKERKQRVDKGKLRKLRPGRGVFVDHTGLRRLLEDEVSPADVWERRRFGDWELQQRRPDRRQQGVEQRRVRFRRLVSARQRLT